MSNLKSSRTMQDVFKYCVFIICMASLSAVKFRCDYTYNNNVGWLKYHKIPAIWKDARLRCRFEGGMLASPSTPALKAAMKAAMRGVDIFTGIHAVSPGNYYSIDGIPLDDFPDTWVEDEPDNENDAERCISFNYEGNFSDVRCDKPHPYICHRPNSSINVGICGTPDPEYRLATETNKCYKFHANSRTFKRAHFVCAAEGGHLAIINSETEARVLREIFAQHPRPSILMPVDVPGHWRDFAFLGFHNYDESADWTTIHGQTLQGAGYSTFAATEPNNVTAGEYCGSIHRNGLLNDLWCEVPFPFICEKDATYPRLCDTYG